MPTRWTTPTTGCFAFARMKRCPRIWRRPLFEWKDGEPADGVACYRFDVREQKQSGRQRCPPEVRLINRRLMNWTGEMPANQKFDLLLSGDLLRFHQP